MAFSTLLLRLTLAYILSCTCFARKCTSGTFENPSVALRPKFRYWLPDASIDVITLAGDIAGLGQRGAGGIEFLNYFNYGGAQGKPPRTLDWNQYGFATPAYRQILEAALWAIEDNGMIMDFSMGPQSGQGVPAEPDDVGLSWELVTFNTSFIGSYHGQIPGWGSGEFISASAFDILRATSIPALTRPEANKTEYTISSSSLVDLTPLVSSNGSISVTIPNTVPTNSTTLFTSYARRSYARANIANTEDPKNKFQNGSFAVDHFSKFGAMLTTSFLRDHVIQPNSAIRKLFRDVGQYIWEDSPEVPSPIYWTPNLLSAFRKQHGYDVRIYIPFLTGFNGDLMLNDPPISIVSDDMKHSAFVSDFRNTMTELYKEYLSELKEWANNYLDMDFSAQVGYNLPVDMLSSIPAVDIPETETLAFLNNVDAFRQFAGAASFAGTKVISIELGADYGQPYSQPLSLLIEEASRAYSAGINQVVIHGASYSGFYPETTYPGYATFGYSFAAHHSRHQPAWDLGYREMLDWLARAQFVLQTGEPKIDLVFWNKQTAQDPFPDSLYPKSDLSDAGFSYTYISPDNLENPGAEIADRVRAPKTIGAKALILRHNDTLTISGVDALYRYASEGLVIVIQGDVPNTYATSNTSAIAMANITLHSILGFSNVHQLKLEAPHSLSQYLAALDIEPRIVINANGKWLTRFLSSSTEGATSVFIFSDTTMSTEGKVSVKTTGVPFILDLWNGVKTPIVDYEYDTTSGRLTIPLRLAAKQAVIIQFNNSMTMNGENEYVVQRLHVIQAPKTVLGYGYDDSTESMVVKVGQGLLNTSDVANVIILSNNTAIDLGPSSRIVPATRNLTDWTLIAEKWVPPTNLSDIEGVIKETLNIALQGDNILPWSYIDGLANSSGIGTYKNNFKWPPSSTINNTTRLGAFLHIPATKMIQGLSISINSHSLPHPDLFGPSLDITPYLIKGSNTISIRISTTLWNSLRPIWNDLRTGGAGPQVTIESLLSNPQTQPLGAEMPVGLAGVVQLQHYAIVNIS